MNTEMRKTLAREPFEEKIRKVEQLVRLAREFPRQLKVSQPTGAKSLRHSADRRSTKADLAGE